VNTNIRDFFTREEVSHLEAGLPRLHEWSDCMLVPFQATQLLLADVIWINSRWFLERRININDDGVRKQVVRWLLAEFGYSIPRQGDPRVAFATKVRTFYADRYGGSTGRSVHGGSGRVATVGCYQAKGIGVTPLAGVGANWVHSHGCVSVEESVREAIFAEIADAEFPFGAVPVVAILDTGLYFCERTTADAEHPRMRRAIIVRPAVLRLAHAERAPLFVRSISGYSNSQIDDVRRTKDVVNRWLIHDKKAKGVGLVVAPLTELVKRIAQQVAFGQVHRLFNGGYFSSNISAAGALLDFGGMRALPSWANARTLDRVVGFGEEMKIVAKVIQSLTFYFNKYRPQKTSAFQEATLQSTAKEAFVRAFSHECLRIWSIDTTADAALTSAFMQPIRRYFAEQQRLQVNYKHGLVKSQGWLYDALVAGPSGAMGKLHSERQVLVEIQKIVADHFPTSPKHNKECLNAWSAAVRYLMPRDGIDREALKSQIILAISTNNNAPKPNPDVIRDLIQRATGKGRRHWSRLSRELIVKAHVSYEGSSALQCIELQTDEGILWLEGIRADGRFCLFDSYFTLKDADELGTRGDGIYWTAQIPLSRVDADVNGGGTVKLRDCSIRIPAMQITYAHPASWLTAVDSKPPVAATA
jgi:hypothetical protein